MRNSDIEAHNDFVIHYFEDGDMHVVHVFYGITDTTYEYADLDRRWVQRWCDTIVNRLLDGKEPQGCSQPELI